MGSFKDFVNEVDTEASAEELEELNEYRFRFATARQLLALRKQESLSQQELAEMTGVAQGDISRIERGEANPTLDTMLRLASAFPGVSLGFVKDGHAVVA
jgi:DNA-binding XRE family transcriptional regulator